MCLAKTILPPRKFVLNFFKIYFNRVAHCVSICALISIDFYFDFNFCCCFFLHDGVIITAWLFLLKWICYAQRPRVFIFVHCWWLMKYLLSPSVTGWNFNKTGIMNHTQFIPLFLLNTHQIIETTFFFYHIRIKPPEV